MSEIIKRQKTVVFIKTHLWDNSIEQFVEKIWSECLEHQIDFFLLAQNNLFEKIPEKILCITKFYSEQNISNLYKEGFHSMWLSNHLISQWFFKNFDLNYDYFWSVEYDVRILGNSSYFWLSDKTEDLLVPKDIISCHNNENKLIHPSFNQRYSVLLQMHRISRNFLIKLNELFLLGLNGQDEVIYGTVCKKYNFSYDHNFINNRIGGIWTPMASCSDHNKKIIDSIINLDSLLLPMIFHPVKNINKNKNKNNYIATHNLKKYKNINNTNNNAIKKILNNNKIINNKINNNPVAQIKKNKITKIITINKLQIKKNNPINYKSKKIYKQYI